MTVAPLIWKSKRIDFRLTACFVISVVSVSSAQPKRTLQPKQESREALDIEATNSRAGESKSHWTEFAARGVSLFNFFFIIYAFYITRKMRLEDRARTAEAFWFRELIMRPWWDRLATSFERVERQITDAEKEVKTINDEDKNISEITDCTKRGISAFKSELHALSKFSFDVEIVDEPLSAELSGAIQQFEDAFTQSFVSATGTCDFSQCYADVHDFRRQFLRLLHKSQPK